MTTRRAVRPHTQRKPAARLLVPPAPPPLTLSERQWQRLVEDLAEHLGWFCWHDEDPRRNVAGFPDLLLIRGRAVLWRELKAQRGRLRPAQRAFGELLLGAGQDWAVWKPGDWDAVLATLGEG